MHMRACAKTCTYMRALHKHTYMQRCTNRQTYRHTDRRTYICSCRLLWLIGLAQLQALVADWAGSVAYMHMRMHTHMHMHVTETDRQTDTQTYRHTDIQTYIQTDGQTDRYLQTDRPSELSIVQRVQWAQTPGGEGGEGRGGEGRGMRK